MTTYGSLIGRAVKALVEIATHDPSSIQGMEATDALEQMAWTSGSSKEETAEAKTWKEVGDMVIDR